MIVRELFARLGLEVDRDGFDAADRLFVGLRGSLAAVGAAVGAAGLGLAAMVAKTAQAAAEQRNMAATSGVAARHFQALAYAANTVGVDAGDLRDVFLDLSERAFDANRGAEEYATAFRKLGISTKDATGKQRDGLDILLQLADALEKYPNKGEAAALSSKLLGEQGARLAPLLNQGRRGIAALADEAERAGLVMTDAQMAMGLEFAQEMKRTQGAIDGVTHSLGFALMPVVQPWLEALREWLTLNREVIATNVVKGVQLAAKAAKVFAVALAPVAIARTVKALWGMVVALRAAAVNLSWVAALSVQWARLTAWPVLAGWITNITALTTAWGRAALIAGARAALAPVVAALPWLALAAIIAVVADDIYTFFTGGDSLIGRYGERWTKWLDRWMEISLADPPFVIGLKLVLKVLTDIEGTLERVQALREKLFGRRADAGRGPTLGRTLAGATPLGPVLAGSEALGLDPWGALFGTSASPQATATSSSSSTTNDNSQKRTVNVGGITINQRYTNGPLEPVPQLREAVRQSTEELFEYEAAATGAAHPKRRP